MVVLRVTYGLGLAVNGPNLLGAGVGDSEGGVADVPDDGQRDEQQRTESNAHRESFKRH